MKLIGKKLSIYLAAAVFRKIYIYFYWKFPRAMPSITRPHVIEMEITSQCNMTCSHCHRITLHRKTGHMDIGLFKKIVDEIASYPVAFFRIVGLGEPAIHPHFSEMMRYLSNKFIKVELTTNGSLFDLFSHEEILSWRIDILGVSVDGVDKISYENIRRGGNYDRLAKNINNFYEYRNKIKKKYPMLCIRNVISTDTTPKQIKEFSDKWIKTADQVTFNTLQRLDLITDTTEYTQCHDIFFHAHINYTGEIRKCGYQYLFGENEVLGNLNELRLSEVWNSYKLKRIRWLHFTKQFPQVCKKCYGFTNKGLEYENARKYNLSKNKPVNFLNKVLNIT